MNICIQKCSPTVCVLIVSCEKSINVAACVNATDCSEFEFELNGLAMKCKYRVRWFYSKGALLVLFWLLLITFVIISMMSVLPSIKYSTDGYWIYGVLLLLSILTVPLTGWLADTKFGNYKVVRFGVLLLFLATVFNCFYHLIAPFVGNALVLKLFLFLIYVFFIVGGVGCSLVLFQLGMDQMPDASSSSISSFITWFVCCAVLGSDLSDILYTLKVYCLDVSLRTNYQQVWSLFLVLSLSCVLISDFCLSKNWLIIEPKSPNSLRTIYQVLKFAAKHKTPLNRSALTYWEEDIPSRMDLGKSRYGGPFTTEQVEDVKTMFRIFLVGLSLMVIGLSTSLHPHDFDIPSGLNICNAQIVRLFSYNENLCFILWTLLHEFLIFPLLRDRLPSILKRIGIASFLFVVVSLICLILKLINYHFEGGLIAIDWTVSVLYRIMQGLITQTFATSVVEFICSQSPYSMRGLLTACIAILVTLSLILSSGTNSLLEKYTCEASGCFPVSWCVKVTLSSIGLIFYCVVARRYKRRVRGDGYFAQTIVEEVYDRYLTPRDN